jgi:hypothetical protein
LRVGLACAGRILALFAGTGTSSMNLSRRTTRRTKRKRAKGKSPLAPVRPCEARIIEKNPALAETAKDEAP